MRNRTECVDYAEEVRGVYAIQLYDARACQSIIRQSRASSNWGAAQISVEEEQGYRSAVEEETRRASVLTPAGRSPIVREFNKKMNRTIKPLVKQRWGIWLRHHSGTHLVCYSPGNFYVPHTDSALDVSDRYFTVLCYLNQNFEGGQTSFPSLRYSVQPHTGKAIVFPATYLHGAEPVLSGKKYVLVTWLIGCEPVPWI